MVLLGHLGIGKRMVRPWSEKLPLDWILLGTILPDIVDKPLYYGHTYFRDFFDRYVPIITGSRTIGHTLLLLIFVSLLARRGSLKARALALGMATHLLLDFTGDLFVSGPSSLLQAALFPLLGANFDVSTFHSLKEHLLSKITWYMVMGEILGAGILTQDWLRRKKTTRPT